MIDYEKVDKLVENCKQLYPDVPDYCLWVLACGYYINESKAEDILAARAARQRQREDAGAASPAFDDDDEEEIKKREELKKEALESYEKAKEELKTTKYENITVV